MRENSARHRLKKYLRFKRSIAAATALVAGTALTVPTAAYGLVQSASGTSAGLQSKFSQAAQEFHVPLPVLLGLSYEESRWDGHHGQYNTEGGYGVMGLTDVTPSMLSDGGAGAVGRHDLSALLSNPVLHTLTAAAKLTGASPAQLRGNDLQNIRGGAALLASYERKLTGGTPPDPAQWYGAVAEYSGILSQAGAKSFVDDVFRTIVQGVVQRLPDGGELHLQAQAVTPITVQLDNPLLGLKRDFGREVECPPGVACTFLPAGSGNYQEANRLADGLAIRYIVIHDTESSYQQAIRAFKNPANGAAANYVMQSSTGKVTQVVPDKDVAFHTGNYWFNMHSVGIEHEGFAASGATWYTTAQYRATAHLVRYLAARYGIPLDRRHIIGHDNVPGPASSKVSGMHWDPGPYWDWTYFMHLLGAGRDFGLLHGVGPVGTAITITPDFATNRQTVQVCGQPTGEGGTPASTRSTRCSTRTQPSNFLYVRTAPRPTAPLFADPGMHSAGTTGTQRIDNWGNTVVAGQQFVVADKRGDWTAIWYAGSKVWFYNPDGVNTTPAPGATIVSAKPGIASAAVYGQAYPQPSEYPWGFAPSTQQPLSMYSVRGGQAYVANAAPVPADDFFAKNPPDTVVTGTEKYYVIQYNHRLALLNDAEVAPHSQVKSQVKSQFQRP